MALGILPFLCNYTKAVLRAAAVELTPEPDPDAHPGGEVVIDGPGGQVTIILPPPEDLSIPARATKEYLINRLNSHPDAEEMSSAVRSAAGE